MHEEKQTKKGNKTMQTFGFRRMTSNNGEGSTQFERTNYALKESVAKDWKLYVMAGSCEIKPYPAFINNAPCASRNPSAIEQVEGFSVNNLTPEDKGQYISEIVPSAYVCVNLANYVGVTGSHYTFIDHCTNIGQYIDTSDPSKARTPYSAMLFSLYKNFPKQGEQPQPGTPRELLKARAEGTMAYSRETILMRGMLLKHKGQPMSIKSAINGTLPKAVFAISQKSGVDAFLRAFMTPERMREPLSYMNNQMVGSLDFDGTVLSFAKKDPADKSSDYLLTPIYNPTINQKIGQVWEAMDAATYNTKLYQAFGAAQNLEDALDFMTVEQMVELLRKAFPASWVWYGLRDTAYAPLVQDLMMAAQQDVELTNWFNPQPEAPANPVIPPNAYVQHIPVTPAPMPTPVPVVNNSMRAAMPSLAQTPTEDSVPMTFPAPTPAVSADQQKADDAMARIKARINGGN